MNALIRFFMFNYSVNYTTYELSTSSIILGCVLGIAMPAITNVIPIQRAMGKNLRSSLDLNHRSINELVVVFKRLSDIGISMPQLVASLMMIIVGVGTYYVAPMAFVYQNFALFLFMMNILLLLMVLGMAFLASLLQEPLERLLARFLVFIGRDKKLVLLVLKNMDGHKNRNAKTAMMFTIALSFLIFTGSSFQLIGNMLQSQLRQFAGADFMINSTFDFGNYLPETDLIKYLDEHKSLITSYSFQSATLDTVLGDIGSSGDGWDTEISGASGFGDTYLMMSVIDENFLATAYDDFYIPTEIQDITLPTLPDGQKDAIAALYTDEGLTEFNDRDEFHVTANYDLFKKEDDSDLPPKQVKLVIPEGLRNPLSVDTQTPGKLCISADRYGDGCDRILRVSFRAMAAKMPGMLFSAYQQVQFFAQGLMSKEQFVAILNHYKNRDEAAY